MQKKKNAFTLAETLIVMAVVAILVLISLSSIKRADDEFGPLYWRAYSALKLAGYNVFVDTHKEIARPFPTELTAQDIDVQGGLCERLIEYINVSKDTNCNPNDVNSSAGDGDFNEHTLQFKGSNSQRFYFSKPADIIIGGEKIPWFIIYVDLNGERGPNSARIQSNGRGADIVAFAMTHEGEVIPMGFPTVNLKYLTAKVSYPDIMSPVTGKKIEKRLSNSMTYFEARHRAWGTEEDPENAESIDFTSRLSPSSQIRNYTSDVATPPLDETTSDAPDGLAGGCIEGNFVCRVIVDSYKK